MQLSTESDGVVSMLDRRVVLFGECGFVGSNLIKRLGIPGLIAPTLQEADLTDRDGLRSVIKRGDIVVNAAGYANATDRTERGKALFAAVNVDGVRNLASVCDEVGVGQLVHISSVAAMGRLHGGGITEDMMKPVSSPYAESKLEGERILADFADRFPVTVLRPTSVFGEGRGLATTLCRLVSRGNVPLPGGGSALIPFTYIGNVAHAVRLSLGNEKCFGKTFIVGDVQSYALREVVGELAGAMGVRVKVIAVPKPLAYCAASFFEAVAGLRGSTPLLDKGRLDTMSNSVSYCISAFRAATGYQPPSSLAESARLIAAWYKAEQERGG